MSRKMGGCSSEPATLHMVACGYGWFQAGHLESKGGWICSPEVLWTLSAGLFSDLSCICMPELSSLEEPSAQGKKENKSHRSDQIPIPLFSFLCRAREMVLLLGHSL